MVDRGIEDLLKGEGRVCDGVIAVRVAVAGVLGGGAVWIEDMFTSCFRDS